MLQNWVLLLIGWAFTYYFLSLELEEIKIRHLLYNIAVLIYNLAFGFICINCSVDTTEIVQIISVEVPIFNFIGDFGQYILYAFRASGYISVIICLPLLMSSIALYSNWKEYKNNG